MSRFEDSLRDAIENSGQTRAAIAQGTGVSESVLSRFVRGHTRITIENAERVADYLGLDIVLRPKRRARGK